MKFSISLLFAAILKMDTAHSKFEANCGKKADGLGGDDECERSEPYCCTMTQVDAPETSIKMCRKKQSGLGIVGVVSDPDDGNKKWKYICPTMVDKCDNLGDCKKTTGHDSYCCQTSIKFPAGHDDVIKTCVPKLDEFDSSDLSATPIGDYKKKVTYELDDENQVQTSEEDLVYSFKCPTMLADCESYKTN